MEFVFIAGLQLDFVIGLDLGFGFEVKVGDDFQVMTRLILGIEVTTGLDLVIGLDFGPLTTGVGRVGLRTHGSESGFGAGDFGLDFMTGDLGLGAVMEDLMIGDLVFAGEVCGDFGFALIDDLGFGLSSSLITSPSDRV